MLRRRSEGVLILESFTFHKPGFARLPVALSAIICVDPRLVHRLPEINSQGVAGW